MHGHWATPAVVWSFPFTETLEHIEDHPTPCNDLLDLVSLKDTHVPDS